MTKIPATVIILTKNEEQTIGRAVTSCASFDSVLVVDSGSTDRTVERAARAGAHVLQFCWNNAYPKKKEWSAAQSAIETDWVILLDADEILQPALVDEIANLILNDSASAIDVPLDYVWQGRVLRAGHRVWKRIAYRRSLAEWPRPDDLGAVNMWEVEGHYQPTIAGRVAKATTPMLHEDTGSLFDYFARQNRYTDWEAWVLEANDDSAISTRSARGRRAARLPAKPLLFFFYAYILRAGFRDGRRGFDYAFSHAVYYWQVGLKRREIRQRVQSELKAGEKP